MTENKRIRRLTANILRDIRVEVMGDVDENFRRQAFYGEAWPARRSPGRPGGHLLVDSGNLRRSIRSRTGADSITFYTDLPYAALHNDGGEITVTPRMKRYFWARYYAARGSFGRKKNGDLRGDRRNRRLTAEADFWHAMALMKTGSVIRMPARRFLGPHPRLEKAVEQIIEEEMERTFQ